jgi:hypothetical protein
MAKFTSRFPELGFYCCGEFRKFHAGQYVTEDAKEIEVLEKLTDAQRVDEEPKAPKAEEAPKAKAPSKKASGK